jgi:hypothetical protein
MKFYILLSCQKIGTNFRADLADSMSLIRTPSFRDMESRQNAHALPRTYVPPSLFHPQQNKEKIKQQGSTRRLDPTRPSANPTGLPGCKSNAKTKEKREPASTGPLDEQRANRRKPEEHGVPP